MAISLLLCLLLALEGGASAHTFSSRLIHRFSEEAKVHLASKGNGVLVQSWPKKGSSEYLRLLLSSDLTRQRMKLGSQYESLYPSEGSQTFFFGNAFDWWVNSASEMMRLNHEENKLRDFCFILYFIFFGGTMLHTVFIISYNRVECGPLN